jgi:hypothetical protein
MKGTVAYVALSWVCVQMMKAQLRVRDEHD